MSSSAQQSFSASQFDQSYRPTRLGNWEVPKATTSKRPTFRGAGYTTKIIVDDNGHILPGKGKRQPEVEQLPEAHRWPEKAPLSSDRNRGAATMGYKGVQTDFLPMSSVYVKIVPGTREYPYAQPI